MALFFELGFGILLCAIISFLLPFRNGFGARCVVIETAPSQSYLAGRQFSSCLYAPFFCNLLPIGTGGWHTFLICHLSCGFRQHMQGGTTALISAAQNGKLDCVHLLVGAGADKEARDDVRPASFVRSRACAFGVGFVFEADMRGSSRHGRLVFLALEMSLCELDYLFIFFF